MLCSIVPPILFSVISYKHTYEKAKENVIASIEAVNNQLSINVNNRIREVERISEVLSGYVYELYSTPVDNLLEYLPVYAACRAGIETMSNSIGLYKTLVFLPSDRLLTDRGNRIDILPLEDLERYNMSCEEILEKDTVSFWKFNVKQSFAPAFTSQSVDVLGYWIVSRNIEKGTVNYAVVGFLNTAEFTEILKPENSFLADSFIVDIEGTIIGSSEAEKIGVQINNKNLLLEQDTEATFTMDDLLYINAEIGDSILKVVTCVECALIRKESMALSVFNIVVVLIIIVFAFFLSHVMSQKLTSRLKRITHVIRVTQGSKDREILSSLNDLCNKAEEKKDDIDRLADMYCSMLLKNDDANRQFIAMIRQEEKLKYQLLQAEINPHFLFNTLSVISTCIVSGEIEIAVDMQQKLAQFYKLLLKTQKDSISIREELYITDLYLQMVKQHNKAKISWDFNVEDGIENFYICRFVLQPLVENAIIHGIGSQTEHLHICINMTYLDDGIMIKVADNGIGIAPEVLEQLQLSLEKEHEISKKNYGVLNVDRRLKPYYADPEAHLV